MSVHLFDVNLLIALTWPNHVHHETAHRWLGSRDKNFRWATCPLTQCGFVRVSSNGAIVSDAATPAAALALLQRMVADPRHEFWPDDLALVDLPQDIQRMLTGHRQVTDAYLLGLAIHHGGKLVTLDRGVLGLLPKASRYRDVIEVVG